MGGAGWTGFDDTVWQGAFVHAYT